jgi:hypothetical protein
MKMVLSEILPLKRILAKPSPVVLPINTASG